MVPFKADIRLPPKPTPADIDRVFSALLTELDYDEQRRQSLANYLTQQKLEFIRHQEQQEQSIPDPTWLINALTQNCSSSALLTKTSLALRSARLEWVEKFCASGGHVLLLRELSGVSANHHYFEANFPQHAKIRNEVLHVLLNLVDSRRGAYHLLYFSPAVEILVQSIDRRDPDAFALSLGVLLPFLFVDHGPGLLYASLQRFAQVCGLRSPFRIFSDILAFKRKPVKYEQFFAFLNGFYTKFSADFGKQQSLAFELHDCGICDVLTRLSPDAKKSFSAQLEPFLDSVRSDLDDVGQLFGAQVRCASIDDLFGDLRGTGKFGALLANLFSIKRNQPSAIDPLIDFITNFLLRYRKALISDPESFAESALKAFRYALRESDFVKPLLPDSSAITANLAYGNLNREFSYISDTDLRQTALATPAGDLGQLEVENERLRRELAESVQRATVEATQRAEAAQGPVLAAAQQSIAEATQRAEAAEGALAEAKQRAEAAESALAEAKQRAEAAEGALTDVKQRAEVAERTAADATKRAEAAESALTDATQRAEAAERTVADATKRAEAAESATTDATQRAEAAERTAADATKRAEAAEGALTDARQRAEAAERAAADAPPPAGSADSDELARVRAELERATQGSTTQADELSRLRDELQRATQLSTTHGDDLQRVTQENATQADELSRLRDELQRVTQESAAQADESRGTDSQTFERVRQELEEVRAQNDRLQATHQQLIELARAIPTEAGKPVPAQLDPSQILPHRFVDLGRAFKTLSAIRQAVSVDGAEVDPALQGILGDLEGLLKSLGQERDTIEANVKSLAKSSQDERAAAATDFQQMRDLQSRIIGGLTDTEAADTSPVAAEAVVIESAPLGGPTRLFLWENLPDSPEWAAIRAEPVVVDPAEVLRLCGTGEVADGRLLSPVTARQYTIALKKINRPIEEIALAVRQESFSLGEPATLAILRLPSSLVELRNIMEFNGDVSTLTEPERLAVVLHRIPDFRGKARRIVEAHRFDVGFQVTLQSLAKVSDGLKRLQTARNLQRTLALVLALGNYVNGGTPFGGAAGFSLNDLLELRYAKTNDKGIRLLHALVKLLELNHIDPYAVKGEMDALTAASRISVAGLLESLKLAQAQLATRPREPFVLAASRRVLDGIGKVQAVQLQCDKITRALGIREELGKGSGLLLLLIDFGNELVRAVKENTARLAKDSAPAAPRPPPASPVTVDEAKARGVFASVVNTVRAAAPKRTVPQPDAEGESEFSKAFAKVRKIVQ